jgi:hypothetical protein
VHHPLKGTQVKVLFEVTEGLRDALVVELADGTTLRILREWTDADGAQANVDARRPTLSTVESLQQLMELVDAFRVRG